MNWERRACHTKHSPGYQVGSTRGNRSSATLDIIPDPLPLDRPHSLMNKFRDSQCPDYEKVAGQIREMVGKIRAGTPLEQAGIFIREKHYTADRLKIERLSGEPLSMDRCYINLAIIEQPAEGWGFEMLFYQEYFKNGGEDKGRRLAKELSQALLNPSTLFILDGLDEVSGGVEHRRLQDRLSVGALEST
ncbi:hypothetical protein ARSEF4850_006678 [Beauveria asiatica]